MPETSKQKNFDIKHLRRISNTFGTSGSLPVLIPLPWCKNSSGRLGNVYVVGGHGYMLRFMHLQKRNSVHRFRRNTWPPLSPEQLYHAYVAIPYYCPTFAWWTGDWVIAGCDLFIIVSIIYFGGGIGTSKNHRLEHQVPEDWNFTGARRRAERKVMEIYSDWNYFDCVSWSLIVRSCFQPMDLSFINKSDLKEISLLKL